MLFTHKRTKQASPVDAAEGVQAGVLVLVDVREPGERAEARPAGSRHIRLGDLPSQLAALPRDRTVAFICGSGSRSATATRAAADHGLAAVNVRGGLMAWKKAGLPVESGPERAGS